MTHPYKSPEELHTDGYERDYIRVGWHAAMGNRAWADLCLYAALEGKMKDRKLREEIYMKTLERIIAAAWNPDAAEGCRLIIRIVADALDNK